MEPGPLPSTALPNRCRHCDPAPCLQVCPAGAIAREVTYGLVLIDDARCIGCAMCAVVCPFDVITFYPLAEGPSPDTAVAVKCDGCIDRQRASREPACVDSCKVQALVFGELNDLLRSGRLRQTAIVLGGAKPPAADQAAHALDGWRAWNSELLAVAVAAERIPAGGAR
ncbi:MAG: 4Fe-4S dicluster domain-containing protein [Chloroflexi bacterium]|nr:4Fe-4S dicluster domain-containing protein [Chloroflexota bacterium]